MLTKYPVGAGCTLTRGDVIPWIMRRPDDSADMILADPPFNIGFKYDRYIDLKPAEAYITWCRIWITASYIALKPGGAFWLCIGDEYAAELCVTAKEAGLTLRNWCIWNYNFGVHLNSKFGRNKTHLLYLTKGKPACFTPPRERSIRQELGDKRANPAGRIPGDVWQVSRLPGNAKERTGHPCQMPRSIIDRILATSSCPGDVVLDLFAGSGVVLESGQLLGREVHSAEMSSEYCRMVRRRLLDRVPERIRSRRKPVARGG